MASEWMRSYRYSPIRSLDDPETSLKHPLSFATWIASRRMRSLLSVALIIVMLFATLKYVDVTKHFKDFSPHSTIETIKNSTQISDTPKTNTTLDEVLAEEGSDRFETNESESIQGIEQSKLETEDVKWSDFAYVQYVTNGNYLCNSLMILEALHRLDTKADRIMMYPEQWQVPSPNEAAATDEGRLLVQARDEYKAKLVPITVQSFERGDPTWKDSYTKLLAFNQTQYKRLISLDSDAIVKDTMDELFLLPASPVAMPRAYWLKQPLLSSQILVIEPSTEEWVRIKAFMDTHEDSGFDMDILNTLYINSALIIPHRRYDLLTSEFRANKGSNPSPHAAYLGSPNETWNGPATLAEAKFIHFSDWPVPKPWINAGDASYDEHAPKCVQKKGLDAEGMEVVVEEDCTDREIWYGFYREYSERRKQICGREYDMRKRSTAFERRHNQSERPWFEPVLP